MAELSIAMKKKEKAPAYTELLLTVTVILIGCSRVYGDEIYVTYDPSAGKFNITSEKVGAYVAHALFSNTILQNGLSTLEIQTNANYPDDVQAYAAGLAEGYLTRDLISDFWDNTAEGYCSTPPSAYCTRLRNFLEENLQWMYNQIQATSDSSPYWHQVRLVLIQLNALTDGFNQVISQPKYTVSDPFGLLFLQLQDDIYDLESVLHKENLHHVLGREKCSALIKLLPGNSDILVAHDTWSDYNTMLRIMKKYDFSFRVTPNSDIIPGKSVSFSSYPGVLLSSDDFYIMSSGLVSLETTIGNYNVTLWQYVKSTGQVFEPFRTVVANRLSNSVDDWANTFMKMNSGTYNNQWMIVDYKKFQPNQRLPDRGVVNVLEQIPGFVEYEDMTAWLRVNTYWASYNIPFFPDVYNMSGMEALKEKYGDVFSYHNTSRARIFRRDQGKVVDEKSLMKLMRYNDYQHDPLSRCKCDPPYSADLAISARDDLNPVNGSYPVGLLGPGASGGLDMKLTSRGMSEHLQMVVISGPTYSQQPAFRWSTSPYANISHKGQPDLFKFDPVNVTWLL